jgi:hypothetical protein
MIVPVKETRAVTKADLRELRRIEIRDFLMMAVVSLVAGGFIFAVMRILVVVLVFALDGEVTRKLLSGTQLTTLIICLILVSLFLILYGWRRIQAIREIQQIHIIRGRVLVGKQNSRKGVSFEINNAKISASGKVNLSAMLGQWVELHCYK